jgi:hypothetical protein
LVVVQGEEHVYVLTWVTEQMERRIFLIGFACLAGCGRTDPDPAAMLPERLEGWVREDIRPLALEEAPPMMLGLGLKGWSQAAYRHDTQGRIMVEVYRMGTESGAFELQQKFHDPETAAFYQGPIFFVVKRGTASAAAQQEFARADIDYLEAHAASHASTRALALTTLALRRHGRSTTLVESALRTWIASQPAADVVSTGMALCALEEPAADELFAY